MRVVIENCNGSLWVCLNVLRWVGFLVPDELGGTQKLLYPIYFFFWLMFIVGIYVLTQTGALIQVWGNMSEMTDTSFLLFTNLALTTKILNVVLRRQLLLDIIAEGDLQLRTEGREEGKRIVASCNRETTLLFGMYAAFTTVTVSGWVLSAEKNQLPFRAWYPYDTTKFPAYHLTYMHQNIAVVLLAVVCISLDQLVASLLTVCRCRLQLVSLSLRTLCDNIPVTDKLLAPEETAEVRHRLQLCVRKHQAALASAVHIQACFDVHIIAQFTVSILIICVTAYQLAVEKNNNTIRLVSLSSYLLGMIFQVFLYCYPAHHLSQESSSISDAAYQCPWYTFPVPLRRALLVVMVRSRRIAVVTAGGLATLSLDCFVAIIKASYSFFTVLQQME